MRTRTSTAPDDAKRVTMQVSTVGIVCNAALTVFKLCLLYTSPSPRDCS